MDIEARNFLSIIDSRFSNLFLLKNQVLVIKESQWSNTQMKKSYPTQELWGRHEPSPTNIPALFQSSWWILDDRRIREWLALLDSGRSVEKLFKLAKELDIQVFATTHSEDTVKAFCKVSLADDEVDGKLISLGHSAAIADNGKILADVYDEKTLAWIVQSGMEVR